MTGPNPHQAGVVLRILVRFHSLASAPVSETGSRFVHDSSQRNQPFWGLLGLGVSGVLIVIWLRVLVVLWSRVGRHIVIWTQLLVQIRQCALQVQENNQTVLQLGDAQ